MRYTSKNFHLLSTYFFSLDGGCNWIIHQMALHFDPTVAQSVDRQGCCQLPRHIPDCPGSQWTSGQHHPECREDDGCHRCATSNENLEFFLSISNKDLNDLSVFFFSIFLARFEVHVLKNVPKVFNSWYKIATKPLKSCLKTT